MGHLQSVPLDQYSSSDASTCSSFDSSTASESQECPGPPPPPVPCDIDDIILEAIPGSRQNGYRRSGGQWVPDPPSSATRAISLRGIDALAPRRDHIEVVAERRGVAAVTQINVRVHPFAHHDHTHVRVTVDRPGEPDLVRACPTTTTFSFNVSRATPSSSFGSIFDRFFPLNVSPTRYRVSAESCGVRNSGPPVGNGHLDVLVYPYDQFTLTLTTPPIGRRSYSRSATRDVTGATTETRASDDGVTSTASSASRHRDGSTSSERSTTREGYTVQRTASSTPLGDGSSLDVTSSDVREAEPDRPTLELKKNGLAEDVTANLTAIVRTLSTVQNAVAALRELVRNMVPQVGFRFEASISFMQGSLAMSWGWKEHTDHQVYFAWIASITLWIFKIGLNLSFGISVGPAALRLVGEINDAGLNVSTTWDLRRPGRPILPPTARGQATLPMEVRGEAIFDVYVARYERSAGARTGFTVEGGTRLDSHLNVELYAQVQWTGLDAFIRTQSPGAGISEDVYHIIDRSEIYNGAMPI
jgi:hypothetical protein